MNVNPNDLPEHIKRLNPELFYPRQVGAKVAQPQAQPALEREQQGQKRGLAGNVDCSPRFRVFLLSLRKRSLDRDNLIGGLKPLRDAIANFLGVDDSERFVEWEYSQAETRGEQETVVRIERL